MTIERKVTVQDDYGDAIDTWTELFTAWAAVRQEGGREFLAAATVQATRKVVFRLRWAEGVTVLDRVTYDGRLHNIQDVRELGRREGVELHTIAAV